MRVLIIGAGKMGCGYLCPLFLEAGWDVVLVTRTEAVAERIRSAGAYQVRVTGGDAWDVHGFDVVTAHTREFDEAILRADLAVTAVGVRKVERLGSILAPALAGRDRRSLLQFWLVENQDSAPVLKRAVRRVAGELGLNLPPIAFAGAVADVTVAQGDWNAPYPTFVRDPASELRIDGTRVLSPFPKLPGVIETSDYEARLREKLFIFSAGHALCAYLGALRGHRFINEAVRDPVLHPLIAGCLLESRSALLSRCPELGDDVRGPVAQALRRYANEELADPVSRVARDPVRKLAPGDRLMGPANLIRTTREHVPAHFALGIAGALLYRDPDDEQARQLDEMLSQKGLASVMRQVCGLAPRDELARAVERRYRGFVLTETGALFPPVFERGESPVTGEAVGL